MGGVKHSYQVMLTFHGRLIKPYLFGVLVCLSEHSFVFVHIDLMIFRNTILVLSDSFLNIQNILNMGLVLKESIVPTGEQIYLIKNTPTP